MCLSSRVASLLFLAALALFAHMSASADVVDSLVASYPFNDNADDFSGHGNNGIVHGAVLATGHTGIPNHAYYFDGVDDYITVPDSPTLNMPGPISISLWVKLYLLQTHEVMPIGKSDYIWNTNYLIRFRPGNVLRWEYNKYYDATIPSLQAERWYHVVVTAESPSGAKQIFVDGQLQSIVQSGSPSHGLVTAPMTMGCASYGSEYLNGTLDDVCVWNRVLTAAEVTYLQRGGVPMLHVSPDTLIFDAQLYGGNPPPQVVNITNAGGGSLWHTTAATASWLTIEPESGGPIPPDASIEIGADLTGLAAGIYHGQVIVEADGAQLRPDTVDVMLSVHDPRVGLIGTDAVIQFGVWYGSYGDSILVVVGPGNEYYNYGEGTVFRVETSVDIGDDIITACQNIWYTGVGGGSVYPSYIRIGGLDLAACGPIADVVVLGASGAELTEYGSDYVLVRMGGGCAGWGCSYWGPYFNRISVMLVPTPCGVCCDTDGMCTLCTEAECPPPKVWHEDIFECEQGICGPTAVKTKAYELALHQNTPNPFNPQTTISFTLPERARVTLAIYDVGGSLVKTLVDETVGQGYQERVWDGRDAIGNQVSSGVYFYRLTAGDKTLTKKMVLLK